MTGLPEIPEGYKPKTFWERPEGTFGMFVTALMALGALWGVSVVLPFAISLLANTMFAIMLGIGLVGLLSIVSSRHFWALAGYGFKSLMRKVTGWFVEIDPIGILENYIDDLRSGLTRMDTQVQNLGGQMQRLDAEIKKNAASRDRALQLASAHSEKRDTTFVLQARQAGRLKKSNMTLQDLYAKMEFLYRFLRKMRETSGLLVDDMQAEVHEQKRQREMVTTSVSAIRTAQRIIKGDPSRRELFDQAMEYLASDYGQKMAEIQDFISRSQSAIDNMDLEQGIYDEDALKAIAELEKRSDSLLMDETTHKQLLEDARDPTRLLTFGSRQPEAVPAAQSTTGTAAVRRIGK